MLDFQCVIGLPSQENSTITFAFGVKFIFKEDLSEQCMQLVDVEEFVFIFVYRNQATNWEVAFGSSYSRMDQVKFA